MISFVLCKDTSKTEYGGPTKQLFELAGDRRSSILVLNQYIKVWPAQTSRTEVDAELKERSNNFNEMNSELFRKASGNLYLLCLLDVSTSKRLTAGVGSF